MSTADHGRLEKIWIKRAHRGPMDAVDTATLVVGRGILGNADQGSRRQVTLIEREIWERLANVLGRPVDPVARRANLLVKGITLAESRDRILQVGPCRIRILGETTPCERMNEACPGLKDALYPDWGGGAYGEVLNDGTISRDDVVKWED